MEDINDDPSLLPSHLLTLHIKDTKCDRDEGSKEAMQLLNEDVDALIGPACSAVCEYVAFISKFQGVPVVSHGCQSVGLSNIEEYPLFVRSIGSLGTTANALVGFLQVGYNH